MNKSHFMIFEEIPKTIVLSGLWEKVIHPVVFVLSGGWNHAVSSVWSVKSQGPCFLSAIWCGAEVSPAPDERTATNYQICV